MAMSRFFLGSIWYPGIWMGGCKIMFSSRLALDGFGRNVFCDSGCWDGGPAEVGSCVGFGRGCCSGSGATGPLFPLGPGRVITGHRSREQGDGRRWVVRVVPRVARLERVLGVGAGAVWRRGSGLCLAVGRGRGEEEAGRQARRSFHTRRSDHVTRAQQRTPIISLVRES
jgi:hypothetical protein